MGDTNVSRALEEGKKSFTAGKPLEAAKFFRAAVTAEPDYEPGWRYLGFALNAGQKPNEAVNALEKALDLNEQDAEAHFGLALALMAMNNNPRAIEQFEKVHQLRPDHPALMKPFIGTLVRHARAQIALANVEWAKKYVERAFELDEKCPEVITTYIEYACKIDNHNLAVEMIKHLEEVKPDYPELMKLKDDFGMLKERERGWLY